MGGSYMNNYYPFVNEPLKYLYNAYEPFIDQQTMMLHHDRHLQTYIDNLNGILKANPFFQQYSLEQLIMIAEKLPPDISNPVKNNAGGVYNHRLYFDSLNPNRPRFSKSQTDLLVGYFGSVDQFKEQFTKAALSVFGSGYAYLVADRSSQIRIITTPNQNVPQLDMYKILMLIDVWEHAYYLKHYNKRVDYIADWFNLATMLNVI